MTEFTDAVDNIESDSEGTKTDKIDQIISAHSEAISKAPVKFKARQIAEDLHQKLANALLGQNISTVHNPHTYKDPLTNPIKEAITGTIAEAQGQINLNLQTPELCVARNNSLLSTILVLLEDDPESNIPQDPETAALLEDYSPAKPTGEEKTENAGNDTPPPQGAALRAALFVEPSRIGRPTQAEYRPGGEVDDFFFIPDQDERQASIDQRKTALKQEHDALRQDYMSTPDEAFDRKSGWISDALESHIARLQGCVNLDQAISQINQMNAHLTSILNTSPREENPPAEIPMHISTFTDTRPDREFPQQLQQILSAIEQRKAAITNAREPIAARSALSLLGTDVARLGDSGWNSWGNQASSRQRLR